MNRQLPDDFALFLYNGIIVPWETGLKTKTGCWDVARTRKQLGETAIDLKCLEVGEIERAVAERSSSSPKDFVYFVSSNSQMQDLFRHLRNCAAHASINFTPRRAKAPGRLAFTGTLNRRPELAICGSLEVAAMSSLVKALVTLPTRPK